MERKNLCLHENNDDTEDESTLHHLRKILANSTFNINEIVSKSISVDSIDSIDDYFMAFNEITKPDDDNDGITFREEDGRISLAYERLPGIPQIIADKYALRTHTLDLSYNNLKDLSFISNFKILHTLILDSNIMISENSLPYLPSMRILWLNKCGIIQLNKWIQRIHDSTPNLRQLSLMGNPGVRSTINGGSFLENYDYMMCVIRALPKLEYLDDVKLMDRHRSMARGYINSRALNTLPVHIRLDNFCSSSNSLIIRKYDIKIWRYHTTHGYVVPQAMNNKANTTKI